MNKLCYRIVFNKRRGLLMAVQENASSQGKGRGQGGPAASRAALIAGAVSAFRPGRLQWAMLFLLSVAALLMNMASAQIMADPSAPGRQQPTVLNTANGVVQVNVQTPSAAGVSRNVYSRFDVPQSGVVLNNSRTAVQTQLGGWVDANPWMARGSARVILNEVNSNDPSQIRGYIEVAGPRAELIVANPAGINVNGGGFINVSRATLTTGTPILNGGALDGYRVQRGLISVDGSGLDASTTDYANLIARSVAINAGVWARQLAVTSGANEVVYDNSGASTIAGSGAAPRFGIDVSELGGMYANKIILLGTEAGVGVHNAGNIGAAAGEVIVTAAGRLENSGSIAASATLQLNAAGAVANSGTVYSDASVSVMSGAGLVNSGTLNGQRGLQLTAASLANSGLINSGAGATLAIQDDAGNAGGTVQAAHLDFSSATGGIDNSGGKIVQTGSSSLDVSAATLLNGAGGKLGVAADMPDSGVGSGVGDGAGGGVGTGTAIGGPVAAPAAGGTTGSVGNSANQVNGSGGATTAPVSQPAPNGSLRAATTLSNNGGQISSGGGVSLAAQSLDNSGGNLGVDNLRVSGATFNNRLGKLSVRNNFSAQTTSFGNQGGSVVVGATFDGLLGRLDNTDGLLQANQLQVALVDGLDNTRGVLRQTAVTTAKLSVGGHLVNELGKIETAGGLTLTAGGIGGRGGTLTTLGSLVLDSGVTSIADGTWIVAGNASLRASVFDNGGGSFSVGKNLTADMAALNNVAGDISAGGNLIISADTLDSRAGYVQAGADLKLDMAGALRNDAGVIETLGAGSAMRVRAQTIDNGVGRIVNVGSADTLIASQSAIINSGTLAGNGSLRLEAASLRNNAGASISAVQRIELGVTQQLANLGGVISSGGVLDLRQAGASLVNSGQITAAGALTIAAGAVDNGGGSIATASGSDADIAIHAASLSNKAGAIVADRHVMLTVDGGVDNRGGALQAAQDLRLSVAGQLANAGGSVEAIAANGSLSIDAAGLDNGNGRIVNFGSGPTTINSIGTIINAGLIAGNGNVVVAAQSLRNQAGASLASAAALELAVRQQLDNAGAISATGALSLNQAGATLNNSGQIVASGTLSLAAHQINNDGGQLASVSKSAADVLLRADGFSNKGGAILSDRDVGIAVAGDISNENGSMQASRSLQLSVGGALANHHGVIEAVGADSFFTLRASSIDNSGRVVNVGSGATNVSADAILNSGTLAGNGEVALAANTLDNRASGTVSAAGQLDLAVTAGLANAGSIASGAALHFDQPAASFVNSGRVTGGTAIDIAAANVVNDGGQIATVAGSGAEIALHGVRVSNRGGTILADGNAILDSTGAFDNDGGTLQAGKNMLVSASGALTNNAGVIEAIAADSTLNVQAANIDNLAGRIVNVGVGAATLSSRAGIVSSGQIAGNGDVLLNAQTVNNQTAGSIAAGKALSLEVTRQLANQGSVSSTGTLRFDQPAASFVNSGKVIAGASSTLRAATIVNDGGQIATAKGSGADLMLDAQVISNRAGTVLADHTATLTTNGALDNSAGTVQAGQDLRMTAAGALTNDGGVIETINAASTLTLQAATIANAGGNIVNAGSGATILSSQGGIVSSGQIAGNGDVLLSAQTVQNQAPGTVVAGGSLTLDVTRQLANQGGISSTGTLRFDQAAASFANSGKVVAGATSTLRAASIINDGGQIATANGSGADLTLSAETISNRGGGVFADRNASFTVVGGLDNAGGTLQAGKDMQLTSGGTLSNDNGVVEAINAASMLTLQAAAVSNLGGRIVNVGTGTASVTSQTTVVNGGVIAGNGDLNLVARILQNNVGGSLVSGRALQLGVTQQLDNLGGAISSAGTLTFNQSAATFNNSGQVVAGGDVIIVADQVNNNAGQLSTATGSQAAITLTAQALSNRGGKIVADGDAVLNSAGAVENTQGVLHAGGSLAVMAGAALSNDAGTIETVGTGGTLLLQGAAIDNGSGRIYNVGRGATSLVSQSDIVNNGAISTNGNLTLQALALQNGLAGSVASGNSLSLLLAQQWNNQGIINSNGTLTFNQGGASLVNSGQIISGGNLTLNAYSINNDGGSIGTGQGSGASIGIASQVLRNVGGKVVSDGDLAVSAQNWQALGTLSAGRDLALTLAGDYTQGADAQLHANRNLSLTVGGTLTNTGTLEAAGQLALTAGQVSNLAGALIQGQDVAIHTTGMLDNAGEINGAATLSINASGVNNSNSIVGGNLSVTTQTLNNTGAVALLGATNSMGLWTGKELNNTAGATIYSAGAIAIAANQTRDGNGVLASHTGTVNNISSTIEAGGNLELTASTVNNIRENVVIEKVKTIDETSIMKMPSWWTANPGANGGNSKNFSTNSSHYHAYEVYFVNPADILEQSTVVTPDGNTVTRVVIRTHANDSVFGSEWGGWAGEYGRRTRIRSVDGTKVVYYTNRADGQVNPDQGGDIAAASFNSNGVKNWDASGAFALSSAYGSCTTNCVRLVTDMNYTDPTHIILRDQQFNKPGVSGPNGMEQSRSAHHTATEDRISSSAGGVAKILSGGDMRVTLGQSLNNTYGEIMAGGAYISTGGATTNTGATLYRTHSFDGTHNYLNAASTSYTAADISEQIGTIGGVISGAQGVYISGRSFNNVDVSAGTVGNVRSGFTVLGSGSSGGSAAAALNGSGRASNASTAGAASGMGDINSAVAAVDVGGRSVNDAAGSGRASGSGFSSDATVQGKTANHGFKAVLLGGVARAAGASVVQDAGAVQAVSSGQQDGKANVIKVAPSGLSKQNPDPNGSYLFETRSQFANLSDWISSDYLLQALKLDPAAMQKRLGDAYYEQNLVRDQLAELTGRTIASGAASDAKYQAMMTSAVSYAQEWGLRPGIALTADQIARLTSDIVWLENQTVSLPDGSVQTVLVPKVYLAHIGDDAVKSSGALVSGENITIAAEDIVNRGGVIDGGSGRTLLLADHDIVNQSGKISGATVALQAGNDIKNETLAVTQSYASSTSSGSYTVLAAPASITATGALSLNAGRDVTDVGGVISAGSAAIVAGRDISLQTAQTGSIYKFQLGTIVANDSTVGHQASTLNTAGGLTMAAGQDLQLSGAQLSIGIGGSGDALLLAGRDLKVSAVTNSSSISHINDPSGMAYDKQVYENESVVGANIRSGGALTLSAGVNQTGSIGIDGSHLSAAGALSLTASGDIGITSVNERHLSDTELNQSSKGLLKKSSTYQSDYSASTNAVSSGISGDSVAIRAGNDLTVLGSTVVGSNAVTIDAGNNVLIGAAQETSEERHAYQKQTSGLYSSGGVGITAGSQKQKESNTSSSITHVASTVGSVSGDLNIIAANDATIKGSDLIAGKDLMLVAQNIEFSAVQDIYHRADQQEFSQSGLTLAVKNSVLDAALAVTANVKRATEVSDSRLAALYAVKAAREVADTAAAIEANPEDAASVGLMLSIGSSSSKSSSVSDSSLAKGSTINAGNNIALIAKGDVSNGVAKAETGNLNLIGTSIKGKDVALVAANDIVLKSAESVSDTVSDNKSGGWTAGIGITVGANTGITVAASANKATGNSDGNMLTHENTDVTASGKLTLRSGGDTTATGAVLKGNQVVADIGGNLTLTSEQDIDDYSSRQKSASVGGSFTFGSMTGSASVSMSKSKTDSAYASVVEQTGIMAGSGGFDITVGGNTGLNGAVIASAAPAANNVLTTQTLTTSDIENKAEYKAVTVGLSASTSGGMRPPSVGASSGSASGTTKSAIGEGTIIVKADAVTGSDSVAGLNRDTSGANGSIEKIFDQKKVEEQQELGKVFGEQAFRAVGDIAQQYTKAYDNASLQLSNAQAYQELKDKESDGTLSQSERATLSAMESSGFTPAIASELAATANATLSDPQVQADYENWKEGSVNKTLLHALAGGMQAGLSGGNISAAALGAGSSEALKDLSKDLPPDLQQWVSTIAGAGAGALAGGGEGAVSGASSAQDGEIYNRQLHTIEEKLISDNAAEYGKQNGIKIEAAIAQLRAQALRQVDSGSAGIPNDPTAAAFLSKIALAAGNQNVGGGGLFDARNSASYYYAKINSVSANSGGTQLGNPLGTTNPCAGKSDCVWGAGNYNQNDVRGGFDEYGNSLVYNPRFYDPAAASKVLILGTVNVASIVAPALRTGEVANIVQNGIRGRAAEARVLQEMGLTKNTTTVSTAEGNAIPDALTNALSVEVKDAANVSFTRQLRIQTGAAREAGRESVLVTGKNTCISGPCENAFDTIIRRIDLGPSK